MNKIIICLHSTNFTCQMKVNKNFRLHKKWFLIFCLSSFGLYHSFYPPGHWFHQPFCELRWNFGPHLLQRHFYVIFERNIQLFHLFVHIFPQVVNWIKIWELWRMAKYFRRSVEQPFLHNFEGMLMIIIMLKYPVSAYA